jgi:hypothetical protein
MEAYGARNAFTDNRLKRIQDIIDDIKFRCFSVILFGIPQLFIAYSLIPKITSYTSSIWHSVIGTTKQVPLADSYFETMFEVV